MEITSSRVGKQLYEYQMGLLVSYLIVGYFILNEVLQVSFLTNTARRQFNDRS
jgi:hypothetical protein